MLSKLMIYQEWYFFLPLIFNVIPCTLLIVLHGVLTSKLAFKLGDCTPKLNGGTSLHPFSQVEPIGFLLFVTTGLGWGAWFPLEPKNFKNPKRDSAILLIVGTLSGVALSLFSLGCATLLFHINSTNLLMLCFLLFCLDLSVLSLSFSLFQWLPLPYFGLFRYASAFFSPNVAETVMKYHRHTSLLCVVVLWSGLLQPALIGIITTLLTPICTLWNLPVSLLTHYFL